MGFIEDIFSFVFCLFNIVLGLAGGAFLALAVILIIDFRDYADENLFEDKYLWGPVAIALGVGVLLLLLCIFGICGLCCKKKGALQAYCALLLLFLGLEIALAVVALTSKDKLQGSAETGIRSAIPAAYGSSSSGSTRKAIDELQRGLDCCGGYNGSDYTSQNLTIPDSCCVIEAAGCANSTTPDIHPTGCGKALLNQFHGPGTSVFAISIAFVVLQVVAFIFSCYKLREYKKSDYTYV